MARTAEGASPLKAPKKTEKTNTATNYRLRKLQQKHRTGTSQERKNPIVSYPHPAWARLLSGRRST